MRKILMVLTFAAWVGMISPPAYTAAQESADGKNPTNELALARSGDLQGLHSYPGDSDDSLHNDSWFNGSWPLIRKFDVRGELHYRTINVTRAGQVNLLLGLEMNPGLKTTLFPLVQHFVEYCGESINAASWRLIDTQNFPGQPLLLNNITSTKEGKNTNHAEAELQQKQGSMLSKSSGCFAVSFIGAVSEKPFDWGAGLGVRFRY